MCLDLDLSSFVCLLLQKGDFPGKLCMFCVAQLKQRFLFNLLYAWILLQEAVCLDFFLEIRPRLSISLTATRVGSPRLKSSRSVS